MRVLLLFVFVFLNISLIFAENAYQRKTCNAQKIESVPPQIDGKLDDAAWKNVPFQDSFVQMNPVENAAPTEETNFKILYDDRYLYLAFVCYDSEPEKIEAQLSRRDDVEKSDFVAIALDSYFDRRTAFIFGVNAAGVRFDAIVSEDGDRMDESWDPVWLAKTSISDSGWIAEMRIPFNQLRFANKKNHTWGFQVLRKIYRKQEEDTWQYIPKEAGGFVSYFGDLKNLNGISMPVRLELLPYSVGQVHTYKAQKGNPFRDGRDFKLDFGLDGKIGLTGDLTMDLTINPDFGQVEADPSVINLSAFETFYEEKRPFFIEGKNIFEFPLAFGDGGMSQEKVFYSRRIGRSPHYYPSSSDGFNYDYIDMPDQTRILGAAKVSGKTRRGWSIGILEAVTNEERAVMENHGKQQKAIVEPLTNYFVTRVQKDFDRGNTSLGGIVTAVNRRINRDYLDFLNRSAYTGGLDFRHQWNDKTYFFNFKLIGSYLHGSPRAMTLVQKSSARYFQRPDADYLSLDTTRTTLGGHGGTINIGRIKGNWRMATGVLWRSPGLELNDIGFLRRADQIMQFTWVGYRIFNPVWIFRNANININQWQGWNFGGDQLFRGGNINGGVQFTNLWGFYTGINRQLEGRSPNLLRGGPLARTTGSWNFWFNLYSDRSKDGQFSVSFQKSIDDDGISNSYNLNFSWYQKVNSQLNFRLSPFYNFNLDNLQYIQTIEYKNENRYLFGRLNQHTFGMVLRLNYSPTPDLSIQYYGQPFISAGKYSHFKNINRPMAHGADRYHTFSGDEIQFDQQNDEYWIDEDLDGETDYTLAKPDFNFKEFRSNLVIRWEYKPGSILYLVWTQDRNDYLSNGIFKPGSDFKRLFDTTPDNTFLIKMNYWFSI